MNKKLPKSFSSLLLICALVASTLFLGAGAPRAYAGFSIVPVNPAERQFTLEIAAGKEKQAAVVIENLSDDPITLQLYGADGTQSNQGTFALTTLSTGQKHIGKWVTFIEPVIKLEGRQHKEVGFTVKVPGNATPGVYSGGIAAESGGGQQAGTAKTGTGASKTEIAAPQSGAISISSRIVVKIFVSVPGQKIHKYEWTGFSYNGSPNGNGKSGEVAGGNGATNPNGNHQGSPALTPNGSMGTFKLHYKNTGNTVIIADQEIQISGFPMQSDSIKLPSATLLQGSDIEIPAKWDDEPFFGFYTAKAIVTFSEYDIVSNTKKDAKTETRELQVFVPLKMDTILGKIVSVLLGVLSLFIILLAITMIGAYRLKKRCRPYVVQSGDTISSIAETCKINWKKLAKLNKLKAPYAIKAGQKIFAPTVKPPSAQTAKPAPVIKSASAVKPDIKNEQPEK